MKKTIKYLSVIIIAIALSATFYVSTNKTNDSVKMQNKEALATEVILPSCMKSFNSGCEVTVVSGGKIYILNGVGYWGNVM